jgi:lipoprotein-anchoring transpeptidase ErfK/SrfK
LTLSLGEKANKAKNAKKVVALHKVPKFRQQERIKKFYDGNLANNRMSHGCINFIEKDFKEFRQYIQANLKVYILPEEDDNKLILSRNEQNGLELKQIKY